MVLLLLVVKEVTKRVGAARVATERIVGESVVPVVVRVVVLVVERERVGRGRGLVVAGGLRGLRQGDHCVGVME